MTPAQFRATAHKIADVIYEKLTGDVGVFSTRIAYIAKQGPRYQLQVADADGYDPQTIVSVERAAAVAGVVARRHAASPTCRSRSKKPIVYVQSLATGGGRRSPNFRGSNSAPAWSPDGRTLAVTLTSDGGSQIFLMNADGGGVQRESRSAPAIDTEAYFTPDGQSLLFTSDRGGSPQIYRIGVGGGAVERLTFEGSYNVSPRAAARRQGHRVRAPRRRPLPGRDPWTSRRARCRC